jgi:hypothetical protein
MVSFGLLMMRFGVVCLEILQRVPLLHYTGLANILTEWITELRRHCCNVLSQKPQTDLAIQIPAHEQTILTQTGSSSCQTLKNGNLGRK